MSTSRRTDDAIADRLGELAAREDSPIADFIDFRNSGPGTLPSLFARSEMIMCTADSSSMISEAVCARRPVLGITPEHHSYTDDEARYRQFMESKSWTRTIALAELTPDLWLRELRQITPLHENHLDMLAGILLNRVPQLFS